MDKDEMLNKLVDNLKSKSDEELIKEYKDAGMKVVDYKPGTQGKVILKDDYFDKVNKALDALSDEEFEQLMIKAGIENCPYEDDIEGIEAYYRKILKVNGLSEEYIKEYLKTNNN